jgi:hypothetical protein
MMSLMSTPRILLRPLKIGFLVALMTIAFLSSNNAVASMPVPFFRDIDAVLIFVMTDPFKQSTFDKTEAALSARQTIQKALAELRHPISVDVAELGDSRILAQKTLSVLIHISVRDAPEPTHGESPKLLASSIAVVRGDLKTPDVIPPMFLAPPEPVVASSDHQETLRRLNEAIGRQLRRAVIKPLIGSSSYRQ